MINIMVWINNSEKYYNDSNSEPLDEDKYEIKLTPQLVANPLFQRQIQDVIFTLIPEVPRLGNLYMTWQSLSKEDKNSVDEYTKSNTTGIALCKPLIDALKKWDKTQDTQGAPGSEPGLVTISGHPQVESGITDGLYLVETLICRLMNNADSDLPNCEASSLSTSLRSVCDEEKDRGDSNLEVIYKEKGLRRSISLDEIPSLMKKRSSMFSL